MVVVDKVIKHFHFPLIFYTHLIVHAYIRDQLGVNFMLLHNLNLIIHLVKPVRTSFPVVRSYVSYLDCFDLPTYHFNQIPFNESPPSATTSFYCFHLIITLMIISGL